MLEIGLRGELRAVVTEKTVASTYESGTLPVFATPAMIALIESAAQRSVQPYLAPGEATVGTQLNVRHLAATPLGMAVRAETELIEIDRRRLVFRVAAYDERELIGEGTHERFIIQAEKFMAKALSK